jgi:signal transduction histidine kinase
LGLLCGAIGTSLGLLGIVGWILNLPILTSVESRFVPMAPETALVSVLIGLCVASYSLRNHGRFYELCTRWIPPIVLLVGIISTIEIVAGRRFELEEILLPSLRGFRPVSQILPSPVSVAGQIILGSACLLLARFPKLRLMRAMPSLALCVGLTNFVVLLGYLYNTPLLYGGQIRPVSLVTAAANLFLVAGLVANAGPGFFPARVLVGPSVTSGLSRLFLPITFLVVLTAELVSDLLRWRMGSPHPLLEALQTLGCAAVVTMIMLQVARAAGRRIDTAEKARALAESQIRRAHEGLERRVVERTAELGRTNRELREEIAERRSAQEALRQSEEKNRALISAIPDWMVRINRSGQVIDFKGPQSYFGADPAWNLPAQRLATLLLRRLPKQPSDYVEGVLSTQEPQIFEFQYPAKEGARHLEARIVGTGRDEVLALIRDITERKRLEGEIAEIRNREQQRIGQDLHDGLGQRLTAIGFLAKSLEFRLAQDGLPAAAEAAKIGTMVADAVAETRRLAKGLIPLDLEGNDLGTALQDLALNFAAYYPTPVCFESSGPVTVVDPIVARDLFRIAQEAINNALKHAKSRRVDVTLEETTAGLSLTIKDDGVGLDPQIAMQKGLGLQIIQYRAKRIGAAVHFGRSETGGTQIVCTLPHRPESSV